MDAQADQAGAVASPLSPSYIGSLDEPGELGFRLFDLPRELRDNIYENALVNHSTFNLVQPKRDSLNEESNQQPDPTPEQSPAEGFERIEAPLPGLIASVKSRPNTNILLCNTVLRYEYEERSKQMMTLVLRDNDNYSFQPVTLPEQAKEVYWAELHLILFCHRCPVMTHCDERTCQAAHEVIQHQQWIQNLLSSQLIKLRAFDIHAYLCYDNYKAQNKQKVPCEPIIQKKIQELCSLPKLATLTLCKYEFQTHPELDGPKVVMLEWPPKASKARKQESETVKAKSLECTMKDAVEANAETAAWF